VKVSKLKPGDVVEGKLCDDVYSGADEIFPSGSRIRLTVDKLGRRRRTLSNYWPWVVKAFTPRHENYPLFDSASILLSDKREIPLRVSLISIGNQVEVHTAKKKSADPDATESDSAIANGALPPRSVRPTYSARKNLGQVLTLEATRTGPQAAVGEDSAPPSAPVTVAAGTPIRIILLGDVSASKNRAGDSVQARVVDPVRVGSTVAIPEGSLFKGEVVKSQPPRTLSRSGSIMLKFTTLSLPGGKASPIAASVSGANLDERSHTAIDPEGTMRADRPGKAWMLLNVGVTAGIAKEADDATQLAVEALVSTATDASTAGVAKIVATGASVVFMLTRHGRDVILPKFTEMEIVMNRPVSLSRISAAK